MSTLNTQQSAAVAMLMDFIEGNRERAAYALLKGYAGTGKTYCLTTILRQLPDDMRKKIALTAPTNKAVKVIKATVGEEFRSVPIATIYSLLGLKLEKSGEVKQLAIPTDLADLSKLEVVVVDEASMVNRPLFNAIKRAVDDFGLQFIFLGDPAQLPPVGEPRSPVWDIVPAELTVELTQIMRFDNQILGLTAVIRDCIANPGKSLDLQSNFDDAGGVRKVPKTEFLPAIQAAARSGHFQSGETKIIAWRNAEVAKYNFLVREEIFPGTPTFYMPGDRIAALEPLSKLLSSEVLMTTDEEAEVLEVIQCPHPIHGEFDCYHLRVRTDSGREVSLYPIHKSSERALEAQLTKLSTEAKAGDRAKWGQFWKLKEDFHPIRHAYAITAHKSQGSTYDTAFVDWRDILSNRDRPEALRCLYVACSRPKTNLWLA